MMKPNACAILSLVAVTAFAGPKKQHVHDHGAAKLAVAADGNAVAIDLDTPADGLYGFEHEAKTDAEKKAVAEADAKIKSGADGLFQFPADAKCTVTSAALKKEGGGKEAHADMNASVTFKCAKPMAGSKMTIKLLMAFPRIKQLKVEILSSTHQGAETVTTPEATVTL